MGDSEDRKRGLRKERNGVVISRSGDKSIVVRVELRRPHARYGKVIKQYKKYHAHDEKNEAKAGDSVRIVETRPLSKMKRWRLVEIVSRGAAVEAGGENS